MCIVFLNDYEVLFSIIEGFILCVYSAVMHLSVGNLYSIPQNAFISIIYIFYILNSSLTQCIPTTISSLSTPPNSPDHLPYPSDLFFLHFPSEKSGPPRDIN